MDAQNSQEFKWRLDKFLEERSRNTYHTGKPMVIKIAEKSSIQIFLSLCSPPPVSFLPLKPFLGPRELLWMLMGNSRWL